jgi:hypothetical protein
MTALDDASLSDNDCFDSIAYWFNALQESKEMEANTQAEGTIGWAVRRLREGAKVRRTGWYNNNNFLIHVAAEATNLSHKMAKGLPMTAYIAMVTPADTTPWLCSQKDLLATDWVVLDD